MPTAKLQKSPKITLRELSAQEITGIYPLISILNPKLTQKTFAQRLAEMLPKGYCVVAAFEGERMIGLSGFWINMKFWCGRQLDIDNFVVHPDYRSKNIGKKLITWLEKKALELKVDLIVLDTYASAHLAHRFYFRNGFTMTGYHMTKIPGSNVPYGMQAK
jgi:GNAT superfamily N-acetyltransferase